MRVYLAGVVFGLTLAAAAWLFTYETWSLIEYVDRNGRHFRPSERIRVQPWWSAPATVGVLLLGAGASVWLLPERPRLLWRLVDRVADRYDADAEARRSPR